MIIALALQNKTIKKAILSSLNQVDYFKVQSLTHRQVIAAIEDQSIDVLIADNEDIIQKSFACRQIGKPFIIFIATSSLISQSADLTLPLDESWLIPTLIASLNLVFQNQRLSHENTQLKNEQQQLEILKSIIIRNVSHELRTPLLQIKSAISLLTNMMNNAATTTMINMASQAIERMQAVLDDIMLLDGSMTARLSPTNVYDLILRNQRTLKRIHGEEIIERIHYDIEKNLPLANADAKGLNNVLYQLLSNALKFSKESVELHIKQEKNWISFEVIDRGIGISIENQDKILEAFVKIDQSDSSESGLGVGLALVKHILEQHKSQLIIKSQLGKGSIFYFKLPIADLKNIK
ncbi:hypothetical protein MASR2M15_23090 [Anaerolineales bacterium]